MNKIKIAFDIDGVCVNLTSFLFPLMELRTGTEIRKEYCHKFSLEEIFGVGTEMVETVLKETYGYWDVIPIYDGTSEFIGELYKKAGECEPIHFVTDRKIQFATETHSLCKRICKEVPFTIAFTEGKPKSFYVSQYPYFVEDRRKNIVELHNAGKVVWVPERTYNEGVDKEGAQIHLLENGVVDLFKHIDLFV